LIRKPWWVFITFLISCSHITNNKELVSVDSYPRGAKVYKLKNEDGESNLLGYTPFFLKEKKDDTKPFVFEFYEGQSLIKTQEVKKQNKCSMVWTDSLLDRIPVIKSLIPDFIKDFGESLNPIGSIRGGYLECFSFARSVAVNLDIKSLDCKKIVAIPPAHNSNYVSKKIIDHWEKDVFNKRKNKCDEFISPEITDVYMDFLGMDHLNRRYGKKYFQKGIGAKIGKRFKATHIVFLPFKQFGDTYDIAPEVYDLHLDLRNADYLEEQYTSEIKSKKRNVILEKIGQAFQLIPNTISLKTKIRQEIGLKDKAQEEDYNTRITTASFPPSIRLSYVEYPHQDWTLNFRFGPSFGYRRFKTDFNLKFLDTVMAMKLFFNTPLGTLLGRVGYGGSFINANNINMVHSEEKYVSLFQYGFEFYRFVTERIFINLGFRKNIFNEDKVVNGNFNLRSYSQLFINVGYYTPEFKIKFRQLFYQ